MVREEFLSGYCRRIDNSRMVAVEIENGTLCEVDCAFETCPHAQSCQIAQKLRELLENP